MNVFLNLILFAPRGIRHSSSPRKPVKTITAIKIVVIPAHKDDDQAGEGNLP